MSWVRSVLGPKCLYTTCCLLKGRGDDDSDINKHNIMLYAANGKRTAVGRLPEADSLTVVFRRTKDFVCLAQASLHTFLHQKLQT